MNSMFVSGAVVTELSGRLHPSAQIPSISILDEILLICKQPRVNSFHRARLSPRCARPKGINTNMKNLDSIPRRPHRRLSQNTNRITSHCPRHNRAQLYSPGGGKGGRIHRALHSGVEIRSALLSGGRSVEQSSAEVGLETR